jgi:hypothetical protein
MTELFTEYNNQPQNAKSPHLKKIIDNKFNQDLYEVYNNIYKNSNYPNFTYYYNNRSLDLGPKIYSKLRYKNKNLFNGVKEYQTEQDEQGLNTSFINNFYGYRNLGGYSLDTYQNIKINNIKTPQKNLYDLF